MVRRSLTLTLLASLLAPALAHADMEPPPAMPVPVPSMEAQYQAAFDALVSGRPEEAAAGFDAVAAGDPARAAQASELGRLAHMLVAKHARYSFGTQKDIDDAIAAEDSDDGRTTFITFSTMYGLYAGVVLIDDLDIDDSRAAVATVTVTTGIGLVASYFGTKHQRITGAMGDGYGLGMIYGMANAGLLLHPLGSDSSEGALTTLLVAGALGGVGGTSYAYATHATSGQISYTSTLGLLGFSTVGLGLLITQPDFDNDTSLVLMAAGMDAGLVAGGVTSPQIHWSPSRGRIAGLGTLLGGLTGAAIGYLITGSGNDDGNERVIGLTTLAGAWGGFGLTSYLTRNMRPDHRYATPTSSIQLTALPVRSGFGAGLAGTF